MAIKRMFSLKIVDTDAFLDMPQSSQLLYFHLVMRADDEGFIGNHKRIIRLIGSNDDDLKILIAKRFVLTFESGIMVIKHWLIHNTIRMDRFNETNYKKEKKLLKLNENKAYTENGNQLATQVKLSKVKLSKVSIAETSSAVFSFKDKLEIMKNDKNPVIPIIATYWEYSKLIPPQNQKQFQDKLRRELRAAKPLVNYPIERIKEIMFWLNSKKFFTDIWTMETIFKFIDKDINTLNEKYE